MTACEECVGRTFGLRQLVYRAQIGPPGVTDWRTFDVGLALKIVKDGRPAYDYPAEHLPQFVRDNLYTEAHVLHVDPTQPGIVAAVPMPDGNVYATVIDGSHRAVRCYREGRPFRFLGLTEQETVRVIDSATQNGMTADSNRMDELERIQTQRSFTPKERAELQRIAQRWLQ